MKIAIAGFGTEGRVSYAYFRQKYPEAEVIIADEREQLDGAPEGAKLLLGEGVFSRLTNCDMVVRSPSIAPARIETNGKVWSATNEFFAECPATIIGVTGTKGKGTTCSLIASILRTAGKTVHLVGNIGVPALDVLSSVQSEDVVVYELSSFQLWDLEKSPHIAVVLMIEPDHLDVHEDFEQYIDAKAHIARYQTSNDTVIYHPTNEYARRIAMQGAGTKQRYGVAADGGVYVKENTFCVQGGAICGVDALHIAGAHNIENACAAISAVRVCDATLPSEVIAEGLADFTGLPHRLKFVAEVRGVRYYDDSIATTPGSAIAAIRSFTQPKILVLGGSDKGASYDAIVEVVKETSTRVIAIGQTGQWIHELCQQYGIESHRVEGGMEEVVYTARTIAHPGDVVILSPASASFDQYKSYADRGEQFILAIQQYVRR